MPTVSSDAGSPVPEWIEDALSRAGVVGAGIGLHGAPLEGGVSSDVWRVELPEGPVCVKRALPTLKVAGEWHAPTSRSTWEARWLRLADGLVPGSTCPVIASDEEDHTIVLAWLDPAEHPVWKAQLQAGHVELAVAAEVGKRLGRLHAGSVVHAQEFEPARRLFDALRIEPYLRATSRQHPDLSPLLARLVDDLATATTTVIHGDVSPKNILVGPDGPVLIDAECASPGDPAFDVSFCLNHLLLKAMWRPQLRDRYAEAACGLGAAYLDRVTWEEPTAVEWRVGRLLPALALARVDGLSPVEYLNTTQQASVRSAATDLLLAPGGDIEELVARWVEAVGVESSTGETSTGETS